MNKKHKILNFDTGNLLAPQRPSGNNLPCTSRVQIKPKHFIARNARSSKVSPKNKEFPRKVSELVLPVTEKWIKKGSLCKSLKKVPKLPEKKEIIPVLSPISQFKSSHRRVLSDGSLSCYLIKEARPLETEKIAIKKKNTKSQSMAKLKIIAEKCQSPNFKNENTEKSQLISYITQYFTFYHTCPETSINFYQVISLIGKGAFAKVLLCEHKITGKKVAIKAISKASLQSSRSQKKAAQEVFILKKINSKFVIKILEVFESEKNFLIVMEYAGGGDLLHYVREKKKLKEEEAKRIFKQIILGAIAIHSAGVLHRDFKLDNILLDASYSLVKICDFGVSKVVKEGELIFDQCGTPAYLAPEIIKNEGYAGFNVDIWSLGVVLYTMLCGKIPFKASNIDELHKVILLCNLEIPVELSEQARDLIRKMIVLNPYDRISLDNVLRHEWFCARNKEADKSTPQFFPRIVKETPDEVKESAVKAVTELGFDYEFVVNSLKNNEMNHATASYYLIV